MENNIYYVRVDRNYTVPTDIIESRWIEMEHLLEELGIIVRFELIYRGFIVYYDESAKSLAKLIFAENDLTDKKLDGEMINKISMGVVGNGKPKVYYSNGSKKRSENGFEEYLTMARNGKINLKQIKPS